MFNFGQRVMLSEFAGLLDEILRDVPFFSVGKMPTRVPARLVPISHPKYLSELLTNVSEIAAVICTSDCVGGVPAQLGCAISDKPVETCFHIHEQLCARRDYFWTDFESQIAPSAYVHPAAHVAEKNVIIGNETFVGPGAIVQERSIIGDRCHIGAGTVISSEAFEMSTVNGRNRLQSQAGGVRLGDEVIFCSNSAVARSIYPTFTDIGDGCGFDNLVHVAHDCVIEAGCKMTACSMLAGRVELKAGAYLGPNSTISNGLTVGENSIVTIGSTVVRNVETDARVTGNFAIEHRKFLKNLKAISS